MLTEFLHSAAENLFAYGAMLLVTLAIVIVIHEFGHYWAAKYFGVHVEQFAFGMGKEICGLGGSNTPKDRKTRWSVCAFPVGGFVKIFGDVDPKNPVIWDKENECEHILSKDELVHAYCSKPVWQRIIIVLAGPAINLLLALSLITLLFSIHGERSKPAEVNALAVDTPSYEAGIEVGDKILKMDGRTVRRMEDIYDHTWYETPIQEHTYTIERGHTEKEISFTAKSMDYHNKKGVPLKHGRTGMIHFRSIKLENINSVIGFDTKDNEDLARTLIDQTLNTVIPIGLPFKTQNPDQNFESEERTDIFLIRFPETFNQHLKDETHDDYGKVFLTDPESPYYLRLNAFESFSRALVVFRRICVDSYKLISASIAGRNDSQLIGGIGKISEHTASAYNDGFYTYIMFLAGFSFMIAIINLLPIPVFDGGQFLFLIYELISGKPLPRRIQDFALIAGLVILLGLVIFANINDFVTYLTQQNTE